MFDATPLLIDAGFPMTPQPGPVREGYHTAIPGIVVIEAAAAITFYEKAFGATVRNRMHGPDGKSILHSELVIGDSTIFISDEGPGMAVRSPESLQGTTSSVHRSVENADASFQRAVDAGVKPVMPPTDML